MCQRIYHSIVTKDSMNPCPPVELVCLNLQGELIDCYESIRIASDKLNICESNISGVLKGRGLQTKGYFFVLKEYYNPEKNYSLKHRKFVKAVKKSTNNHNYTKR